MEKSKTTRPIFKVLDRWEYIKIPIVDAMGIMTSPRVTRRPRA
jgi:hypothetical protein